MRAALLVLAFKVPCSNPNCFWFVLHCREVTVACIQAYGYNACLQQAVADPEPENATNFKGLDTLSTSPASSSSSNSALLGGLLGGLVGGKLPT